MAHRLAIVRRVASLKDLETIQILALHEGVFAPLDPLAKERITQAARASGWDRTWDDAPYAA